MLSKDTILEVAKKHFPFEKANPGQMEAVVDASFAILNNTHKHVFIEAPTGIGKSIIALTVHKTIAQLFGDRFRTTIITTTKGLQDQYAGTDEELFDLRGKTNYPCRHNVGPYNSGECRVKVQSGKCKPESQCDYVMTRKQWCNSEDMRMTNHSFQIEACPTICMLPKNKANLIVIDECHEVDDNIIEHTKIELNANDFKMLKQLSQENLYNQIVKCISMYSGLTIGSPFVPTKEQTDAMNALHIASEYTIGILEDRLKRTDTSIKTVLASAIEALQQISDKADIFGNADQSKWLVSEYTKNSFVSLKPIFASSVAKFALFRKADYFIHMSATICGFETYADILGIPHNEVKVIAVDNPIPIENRKIFYKPMLKVSGDINYNKIAEIVDSVIEKHVGDSGIIHTVSFTLAQEIMNRSKHKKRMLVSGNYVDITRHLRNGGVVLSPSIERGFDAKGDLSRFQIIAKIPFGFLGDPLTKLNAEVNKDWYARKTILRLTQACGRSVRGIDDYASTYIFDSNFSILLERNIELFNPWFLDALVIKK